MKLYISGPMRGIPRYNFDEFDSLAAYLRDRGYKYINPADHDREVDPECEQRPDFATGDPSLANLDNFHQLLGWDLAQIASPECDGVVMLPGWENSTGAQHERYVAEACGKAVLLAKKTRQHSLWTLESCSDRSLSAKRGSLHPTPTPVIPLEHRDPAPVYEAMRGASSTQTMTDPYGATSKAAFGGFVTKDSGKRKAFDSGMVRDTDEGKPRYDLIPIMPLRRLAELYARGAVKYGDCNWQKANSAEEMQRFKASCLRHLYQWLNGEQDEDHAIGAVWNIFAVLWLEDKLNG